jgi:phosphohistidine phosphatase SixA
MFILSSKGISRVLIGRILALALCILFGSPVAAATEADTTVVYLVRHAEKEPSQSSGQAGDPDLTDGGRARAELLAAMLRAEKIDRLHSTDFTRTLGTARPLAGKLGLKVDLYDPRELKGFAAELLAVGGRHVVIGHSNTTTILTELLGGEPGTEIDEPTEYDRLYVVIIDADGRALTLNLRYGSPPSGGHEQKGSAGSNDGTAENPGRNH